MKQGLMARFIILFFFLLCQAIYLRAQTLIPQIEFIKSYGGNNGEGESIIHFTQDGYIMYAGSSNSTTHDLICNSPASRKAWLLKTDKQGNEIFSYCFGGTLTADSNNSIVAQEYFFDMAATADSGCIATCYTTGANFPLAPFPYACDDSAGGFLVLSLVKYDKNGNIQWTHCYGGGQDDGIYSITPTSDGGYIFLAQVRSTGGQVGFHYGSIFSPDCWLVKLDSVGDIQWKEVLGGTGDDWANKVKEISPGRYMTSICTNSTDGNLTNVPRYTSDMGAWFCIFDSAGDIIKQALIPWYGLGLQANDFILTKDGGLIFAGFAYGIPGVVNNDCNASTKGDFAVFKLDSSFNVQWCNIQDSSLGELYSITELPDSVFLVCGNSESPFYNSACLIDTNGIYSETKGWMMGLDIHGNLLWRRSLCASQVTDLNYSLYDTLTGTIYISGGGNAVDGDLTGVPNYGNGDEWLLKIDMVDGINQVSGNNCIRIFPNPTQDYLYVTLPQSTEGKIILMDIAGRELSTTNTNGKETETLNMAALPSGVYILLYQDANMSVSRKVVKE